MTRMNQDAMRYEAKESQVSTSFQSRSTPPIWLQSNRIELVNRYICSWKANSRRSEANLKCWRQTNDRCSKKWPESTLRLRMRLPNLPKRENKSNSIGRCCQNKLNSFVELVTVQILMQKIKLNKQTKAKNNNNKNEWSSIDFLGNNSLIKVMFDWLMIDCFASFF